MFAQNGPTVREITQELLQRAMEDLQEYCHSVADERKRLWEHDIPARQLDARCRRGPFLKKKCGT